MTNAQITDASFWRRFTDGKDSLPERDALRHKEKGDLTTEIFKGIRHRWRAFLKAFLKVVNFLKNSFKFFKV